MHVGGQVSFLGSEGYSKYRKKLVTSLDYQFTHNYMIRANKVNLPPEPKWELPKPKPRGRAGVKGTSGKGNLGKPIVGTIAVTLKRSLSVGDIRGAGVNKKTMVSVKKGKEEARKAKKVKRRICPKLEEELQVKVGSNKSDVITILCLMWALPMWEIRKMRIRTRKKGRKRTVCFRCLQRLRTPGLWIGITASVMVL